MARLIDVDALIEAMDKRYNEKKDIVPNNLAEGFMQMEKLIKEQPTAYDVEKVVAELDKEVEINEKEYKKYKCHPMVYNYERNFAQVVAYKHAIDLVRKGGVE